MQQHEECFEALRARETERAVRIMVEHYDMLLQRMKIGWNEKRSESPLAFGEGIIHNPFPGIKSRESFYFNLSDN